MAIRNLGIIAPHPPIMVPEVGHAEADVTTHSADALAVAARLMREFDPDTIVVMSPHASGAYDAFGVDDSETVSGDLGQFGAPQVRIRAQGDPELAAVILGEAAAVGIPAMPRSALGTAGVLDHGVLVPMSFIDRAGAYPLLVLSFTFLEMSVHREFGRAVRRAVETMGRRAAFVASGDCSHRLFPGAPAGYAPGGRDYDRWLVESIGSGDFDALTDVDRRLLDEAGECGTRSFVTLGGFLDGTDAQTRVLTYEGPWGVGYLTAVASDPDVIAKLPTEPWVSEATATRGDRGGTPGADASPHTRLARAAITRFLADGTILRDFAGYEELVDHRAGAFVSLHWGGDLRGCIGCIEPMAPSLAEEIVDKAIDAAVNDPRFPAMTADELEDLDISVDVLQPPEPVTTLEELDPRVYGVIVTRDWRRGLLLPDLEGVDSAEDQVNIAMRKAGIMPGERVSLERFRVDRFF
jgi:AmmeMemoRadiSam system protein A